jgi:hypothetical protein
MLKKKIKKKNCSGRRDQRANSGLLSILGHMCELGEKHRQGELINL